MMNYQNLPTYARQRMVIEILKKIKPSTVVEVGCGLELLYNKALNAQVPIKKWIIVDPSNIFIKYAKNKLLKDRRVYVIHGFFEDSLKEIKDICKPKADFIIISGLLHEVKYPKHLLR